jgi:hypothetical protein
MLPIHGQIFKKQNKFDRLFYKYVLSTSVSVASGRPYLIFSITEVANNTGSYEKKIEIYKEIHFFF